MEIFFLFSLFFELGNPWDGHNSQALEISLEPTQKKKRKKSKVICR